MHRITLALGLCGLLITGLTSRLSGQQNEADELARYRQTGLNGGDPERGKTLFESEELGCKKGTIFRLVLDDSEFGADVQWKAHVRLLRNNAPAAARVSIVGSDNKPYAPVDAAIRKTKHDESYFYVDDSFDVKLPPGRVRLNFSGGIETIPQRVTVDSETATELTVQMPQWIDMAARRLVFGRFARTPSYGRPDRGDGCERAGRGSGGGGQLCQSLRVEQRRE